MRISRSLVGQTPYQTNTKVYDAAQLQNGQLLMNNAAGGITDGSVNYFITAAANTAAEALNALGATMCSSTQAYDDYNNTAVSAQGYGSIGSNYYPDAAMTAGLNYMPVCISPQVMYFADYYQINDNAGTPGDHVIADTVTASTSTTITIGNLEDQLDGGWFYTTKETSATADFPGQLRYITVSTGAGVATIANAMSVSATTDFIKILPAGHNYCGLTDDAVGLSSITDKTSDDTSVGLTTSIVIWDNWGKWESASMHPLRYWVDKASNGIDKATFTAEIFCAYHYFYKSD